MALEYLFYNFGQVSSEEVKEKEMEIMAMDWNPADPIVLITRPLEQLRKLVEQAKVPYTDAQILDKGLSLIKATRDYEYALTLWDEKPSTDKTWPNFKNHFHEAQLKLKSIRGPTMQQAGFHQANSIINRLGSKLQQSLHQRDEQLTAMINNIPSLIESSSQSDDSDDTPPTHTANAMQQNQIQLQILKLLKEIKAEMKSSKNILPVPPPNCPVMKGRKTPDAGGKGCSDISKYCWTHGACDHNGHNCFFRAEGHKVDATFGDKKGGSKARCS